MASKMMQAEATKNTNMNVDTLMNMLGRYYQVRDDYQDLTGAVRLSSPIHHSSLKSRSQVSRKIRLLQRSRPRHLHPTHYPCTKIPRRERQYGTPQHFSVKETGKWHVA